MPNHLRFTCNTPLECSYANRNSSSGSTVVAALRQQPLPRPRPRPPNKQVGIISALPTVLPMELISINCKLHGSLQITHSIKRLMSGRQLPTLAISASLLTACPPPQLYAAAIRFQAFGCLPTSRFLNANFLATRFFNTDHKGLSQHYA